MKPDLSPTALHGLRALALCLALAPLAAPLPAHSSSAAADALKVLTQPLGTENAAAPSSASPAATPAATPAMNGNGTLVTVRRGETVDMIIKRHWGQLPLSIEFLRSALVRANPQAFPNQSVQRLQAGTVLRLPGPAELHTWLVERHPAAAALFRPEYHEGQSPASSKHDTAERKRWVRYP